MKAIMLASLVCFSLFSAFQSHAGPKKNLKKSILIAAVVESDEQIQIFINTRAEWTSAQRLTDSYSKKEQLLVEQITDKLNLCNLEESTFEPCTAGRTVLEIKKQLENSGVEVDISFEQWIAREIQP